MCPFRAANLVSSTALGKKNIMVFRGPRLELKMISTCFMWLISSFQFSPYAGIHAAPTSFAYAHFPYNEGWMLVRQPWSEQRRDRSLRGL